VRKTLKSLPPTLDATYERILLNIEPEYQKEALSALMWLVASERPLLLGELAEAAIIDINGDPPFQAEERLFDPKSILVVLSTLVSVTPRDGWDDENENGDSNTVSGRFTEIRLAHYSVREYLTSDRLAQARLPATKFHIVPPVAHHHLAFSCVAYISYWGLRDEIRRHKYWDFQTIEVENTSSNFLPLWPPLLVYALKYWATHALRCGSELPESLKHLIVRFLLSEKSVKLWTQLVSPENGELLSNNIRPGRRLPLLSLRNRSPDPPAPPLYHAACLGLTEVVTELLNATSIHCETGGNYNSPLQVASFKGHEETVLVLLRAGADVNALGGKLHTALEAACIAGNARIVNHLLEFGAVVDVTSMLKKLISADKLNAEIVTRLLKTTDFIDHRIGAIGWVMKWASWYGHTAVVRHLLDRMRELKVKCSFYWTVASEGRISNTSYQPLGSAPYEAAVAGNLEVLQLLVPRWLNINENSREGSTALYWAAVHGDKEIVQLLLAHSADVHGIENFYGWTAHSWAHYNKSADILEMLEKACNVEDCRICPQRLHLV
jgi:ankyrin repeat protein